MWWISEESQSQWLSGKVHNLVDHMSGRIDCLNLYIKYQNMEINYLGYVY